MKKKKLRRMLIKLQNKVGKTEGKIIWLQKKKEIMNGLAS